MSCREQWVLLSAVVSSGEPVMASPTLPTPISPPQLLPYPHSGQRGMVKERWRKPQKEMPISGWKAEVEHSSVFLVSTDQVCHRRRRGDSEVGSISSGASVVF